MLKSSDKWKSLSFFLIGILTCYAVAGGITISREQLSWVAAYKGAISFIPSAYAAGALTNVFAMPSDNTLSTMSYYTIAFNTATAGIVKSMEITFPAGFNIASSKLIEVQGIGVGSISVTGQILKYTVSSPVSIPAARSVKIMIANIINSAVSSNQISVVTKDNSINSAIIDGPTNSAIFNLIQVTNPMIGNSAVTSTKLGTDSVDSFKIKDGQVGLADMAANSVDGSTIKDSSISKADVSTAFIKKVSLSYPQSGWNPGLGYSNFVISDSSVTATSVIQITVNEKGIVLNGCNLDSIGGGWFDVNCGFYSPAFETKLNYVVIN